ncbi:hypothetical protein QTO34_004004 [Cnephaeus nilssonii]|uniref:40S ribosomal protein S15 n=1 Tax=Cnephaeus nilssonii TaxID=3371016 RepID=A0AA40HSI9_CNENI|nr:hypothetical protein QTO34_004004 [Eptesicus nilssonii]
MAEVEQKKQRTFRKVTYLGWATSPRGRAAEEPRAASKRWPEREARSLLKRLRLAKKEAGPTEKPQVVEMHLWDVIISRELVGFHNGMAFNQVQIGGLYSTSSTSDRQPGDCTCHRVNT